MLDKLGKICKEYTTSNKHLKLFAVLKMDDLADKWSIILATDEPQNQDQRRVEYAKIIEMLTTNLEENELNEIARVGFFDEKTHLIEELSKYQVGSEIRKAKINGNFVFEGHIMCSDRMSETTA